MYVCIHTHTHNLFVAYKKSHTKIFTFGGVLDFQMKIARIKEQTKLIEENLTLKRELLENKRMLRTKL